MMRMQAFCPEIESELKNFSEFLKVCRLLKEALYTKFVGSVYIPFLTRC
jgi:hypothetical protein